jgi:hypothetical protein
MNSINPDFTCSETRSLQKKLTPRCPFAHCRLCSKYYESCWCLSQEGLTAKIDSEKELDEFWEKSKLTPCKKEESPAIINVNGKVIAYCNFCPMVLLDRFGYSASRLAEYADEKDKEVALRWLKKENVPLHDSRWRWSGITRMHFSVCGYYSILKDRIGRGK